MVSHSLEKKKEAKRRSACISFLFSRVEQQQQQQQLLRVVICLAWPALLGNRQTKRVEGGKTARPCLVDFRHHDGRPTSCLLHLLLFTQSKLISFEKILTNFPRWYFLLTFLQPLMISLATTEGEHRARCGAARRTTRQLGDGVRQGSRGCIHPRRNISLVLEARRLFHAPPQCRSSSRNQSPDCIIIKSIEKTAYWSKGSLLFYTFSTFYNWS